MNYIKLNGISFDADVAISKSIETLTCWTAKTQGA